MVREGALVVVPPDLDPAVRSIAERVAAERGAELLTAPRPSARAHAASRRRFPAGELRAGRHGRRGAPRTSARARRRDCRSATRRACRDAWTWSGRTRSTVYDGAHNPSGAEALAGSLAAVLGDRYPRVAVIGVLEDKDAAAMLARSCRTSSAWCSRARTNPRALSPATLASLAEKLGGPPGRGRGRPARRGGPGAALAGPRARSSPPARST